MIISIDIDGVLVDREGYQNKKAIEYAKKHNLNSKILKPDEYNVHNIFGWDKSVFLDFWNEYLWDYAEHPPIKGVKEVLEKLKADGHKIVINTSRWLSERDDEVGTKMRETVRDWFEKYQLPFDQLVFACGDKVSVIDKEKADCHIEDSVDEAKPIAAKIPVIVFHATYNQSYNDKNTYRAKTWQDVYEIIKKLEQNQFFNK